MEHSYIAASNWQLHKLIGPHRRLLCLFSAAPI
jgi:hypothetical protein